MKLQVNILYVTKTVSVFKGVMKNQVDFYKVEKSSHGLNFASKLQKVDFSKKQNEPSQLKIEKN